MKDPFSAQIFSSGMELVRAQKHAFGYEYSGMPRFVILAPAIHSSAAHDNDNPTIVLPLNYLKSRTQLVGYPETSKFQIMTRERSYILEKVPTVHFVGLGDHVNTEHA